MAHATVDAWVIKEGNEHDGELTVLCTNWGLPRHPIARERVQIFLNHAPRPIAASIQRIDVKNANAKSMWIRMGEPEYLSDKQVQRLHAASELEPRPMRYHYAKDTVGIAFTLMPQSVAAVSLQLKRPQTSFGRAPRAFTSGEIPE